MRGCGGEYASERGWQVSAEVLNQPPLLGFDEFAALYCETQDQTPDGLREVLTTQARRLSPDGWMLLECIVLDSSRIGERVILPFGGGCTWKGVPNRPVSPRGLASDISKVIAVLPAERLTAGMLEGGGK